jgi:hypothetical protein
MGVGVGAVRDGLRTDPHLVDTLATGAHHHVALVLLEGECLVARLHEGLDTQQIGPDRTPLEQRHVVILHGGRRVRRRLQDAAWILVADVVLQGRRRAELDPIALEEPTIEVRGDVAGKVLRQLDLAPVDHADTGDTDVRALPHQGGLHPQIEFTRHVARDEVVGFEEEIPAGRRSLFRWPTAAG